MTSSSCRTTEWLGILSCKSLITLWEGHFESSFTCLRRTPSPVPACHLLANWAFCRLLEWSFLVDTGVLSQHVWKACQSPGSHWKLSAVAGTLGNLIYSHFSPSFIALHFSGTLPSIRCSHLGKVILLHAMAQSDPAARLWWCRLVWKMSFSETLTCFFLIKIMMCQHS